MSRSADAAVEAIRDLRAAKLSYQRTVARRITFGRRWRMRDGSVRTNPGTNHPDAVDPVDAADETVQVLRIRRMAAAAFFMPETKGKTLEEIEQFFVKHREEGTARG